ncbi:hypothetical protein [Phytohabitans houttuyneae]|uniref:DUF1877 domain-containing protein n=1 Tax=Phytohabitans houttuyneae TaxID=1076126 RepID=A0A6V8K0I5_9ACTN|nr:hypothetical protein [Phytohabitans houttuyneae]GFJ77164.1 hypothetical protein Phou_013440 [Phytohabitans houttuyneae]
MGVLCDYFRAADDTAVAKLMEATDGGPVIVHGDASAADGVDAKGIEPNVTLGKLVALILDVEWDTDISGGDLVWPPGDPGAGPWVQAIHTSARDALAGVDDARLPELAERWAAIEELAIDDPEGIDILRDGMTRLVALARRARAAGDQLYCWISL